MPRKTKVGTELAHVTRDSDTVLSRSKGQRSRSSGRLTHHSGNASGNCSGERENLLTVGTYCYVAVCTLQARSARRHKALWLPQREERDYKNACKKLVVLH